MIQMPALEFAQLLAFVRKDAMEESDAFHEAHNRRAMMAPPPAPKSDVARADDARLPNFALNTLVARLAYLEKLIAAHQGPVISNGRIASELGKIFEIIEPLKGDVL